MAYYAAIHQGGGLERDKSASLNEYDDEISLGEIGNLWRYTAASSTKL